MTDLKKPLYKTRDEALTAHGMGKMWAAEGQLLVAGNNKLTLREERLLTAVNSFRDQEPSSFCWLRQLAEDPHKSREEDLPFYFQRALYEFRKFYKYFNFPETPPRKTQ